MKAGFINRRCPRCGGNLYLDNDYYVEGRVMNSYDLVSCLQCGYIIFVSKSPLVKTAETTIEIKRELVPV